MIVSIADTKRQFTSTQRLPCHSLLDVCSYKMASSASVQIVSQIDITSRYRELGRELESWENRRNEQGGFDLELGTLPRMSSAIIAFSAMFSTLDTRCSTLIPQSMAETDA